MKRVRTKADPPLVPFERPEITSQEQPPIIKKEHTRWPYTKVTAHTLTLFLYRTHYQKNLKTEVPFAANQTMAKDLLHRYGQKNCKVTMLKVAKLNLTHGFSFKFVEKFMLDEGIQELRVKDPTKQDVF